MNRKSLVMSALMFAIDFFSAFFKELKKRGITEERMFDALKSKDDLIPQMAEKCADLILGTERLTLKYLVLIVQGVQISAEAFSKSSFFANRPKLYFWNNFKNCVLSKIPDVIPAFTGSVTKTKLSRGMYDKEILGELGNPTPFTVAEFATIIKSLIGKQSKRENGDLSNDGDANIFYVELADRTVVVVSVYWDGDLREWHFNVFSLDRDRWSDGSYVFSRS